MLGTEFPRNTFLCFFLTTLKTKQKKLSKILEIYIFFIANITDIVESIPDTNNLCVLVISFLRNRVRLGLILKKVGIKIRLV